MKRYSLLFLFGTLLAMDVERQQIYDVPHKNWRSKFAEKIRVAYDSDKKDFQIYRCGELINVLHGEHLRKWKLTDSNYLVMATERLIQVFDANANKMLHTVKNITRNLKDICYSPKHNLLFACHGKGVVNIWRLGHKDDFKLFKHDNLCNNATLLTLALTSDEDTLAVGSADNCIKFFNLSSKKPKKIPKLMKFEKLHGISSLAWHQDGRVLALGDFAGMVVVLDKKTLATKHCDKAHSESITSLRFVRNNNLISYSQTQRSEREINVTQ